MEHIRLETEGDVTIVRIDRPPANALDLELLAESHELIAQLRADPPAAVVITGRDGYFSAGVDLKLAPTLGPDEQRGMVEGINRLFGGWYSFPRPLVCAVNGHAIAGGFILALCGDYRVGARHGKLGLTELSVGIPYPAAAIAVVRAELTPRAARQLVLRANLIDPEEAHALGATDELADDDALLPRALEVAGELAALPQSVYATVKEQLRGPTFTEIERPDPTLDAWLPSS